MSKLPVLLINLLRQMLANYGSRFPSAPRKIRLRSANRRMLSGNDGMVVDHRR